MSFQELPDAVQQQLQANQEEQKVQKLECPEKMEKIQTIINKKKLRTGKLDCVIVMDLTQSMDPYIEKMQKELCAFIQEIKLNNKELDIQFGFIGYKDFCDDPEVQLQQSKQILSKIHKQQQQPIEFTKLITGHLSISDFSADMEKFQEFLMQMYAEGGGDLPEDVAGGLHRALSLSWRSESSKIVILVADQPTHGEQYQDPILCDDYPKGHPFGIQLEEVITTYAKMNAMFLIFKITDNTEKMFQMIKTSMKERQAKVRTIDLRKALKRKQKEKKMNKSLKKEEMEKLKKKEIEKVKKIEAKEIKKKEIKKINYSNSGSDYDFEEEEKMDKKSSIAYNSGSDEEKEMKLERKLSVCSIVNMKIADKIRYDSDDENLSCNEEID